MNPVGNPNSNRGLTVTIIKMEKNNISNGVNVLEITSKDNEKIKFLKKLKKSKYRDQFGKFFVESATIIADAAKAGFVFESLFATKNFIEKNRERFDFVLKSAGASEYYLIDEKVNKSFSDLETAPGIAAVYSKPERKIDFTTPIVYLNGIADPGNLGTILRSALAFNFKNIVVDEYSADVFNYKTIQAARDAIFKVNIEFDMELALLAKIKQVMKVFSTRLEKSEGIGILKGEKLFCLVLGSETRGVDKKILDMTDHFLRIETGGEIESLNVASAAAIIFYEVHRRA